MIVFFQSLGVVFTLVVLILLGVATMYLGYIVAIAVLLAALIYIVYSLLTLISSGSSKPN